MIIRISVVNIMDSTNIVSVRNECYYSTVIVVSGMNGVCYCV